MASVSKPSFTRIADWDVQYVGGEWRQPEGRDSIQVKNPATLEEIVSIPSGNADDIDDAYQAASNAQEEWAAKPPQERIEVLTEALEIYEEHREEITDLISKEVGGTQLKANVEFGLAGEMLEEASSHPFRRDGGSSDSVIPGKENVIKREPVGTVGVITPWNFPVVLSMRAVAPALALGNAVVLKPAEDTPITGGLLFAWLFEQAGLPEGLLNVVPGYGQKAGDALAGHPDASVIAFTGSTEVGREVAATAGEQLTLPALELGGNNPHIVTENADLDRAVDGGVFGSFMHQGQVCISINRHLVHESHYDEYVERLTERAASLPVGDPADGENLIGPVINESQRDQIVDYIERSVDQGATLETGGDYDGLFVEPTVLSDVTNDMPTACNEHFGPVAPVIPFERTEEAIEIANDTEYGLSAAVHSQDLDEALDVADAIESGMVHINDQPLNDDPQVPFGGVKDSGIGRYNGDAIIEKFTQTKWVSIQREPRQYPF